ncbi:uncharacterized protein LOC115632613 [Scaptodrosophila lebanonensis]|uniref:Uncharacterized protein LOC115632613 n=1 Tax=Drosophila lebanonensis TaxID=7225 RepID=A0A6J2UCB1_DROLE|nr:uncharacterized protein LOC115632613 [Scaptodrosophila lebanonensis]
MSSQMEPIVVSVEALDDDESESLDWVVDPSKALQPKDIFHDVQKFVVKIYEFVQHPKDSAYNGFAYSLQPIFKKHKQHNQQKQQATIHKVMLDPFGNFSFTLGFSLNFQVSNTVGFTKTR